MGSRNGALGETDKSTLTKMKQIVDARVSKKTELAKEAD